MRVRNELDACHENIFFFYLNEDKEGTGDEFLKEFTSLPRHGIT